MNHRSEAVWQGLGFELAMIAGIAALATRWAASDGGAWAAGLVLVGAVVVAAAIVLLRRSLGGTDAPGTVVERTGERS